MILGSQTTALLDEKEQNQQWHLVAFLISFVTSLVTISNDWPEHRHW